MTVSILGNPILKNTANAVTEKEYNSKDLACLIDDLIAHMEDAGGVGIAAPQIGISKRIFVYSTEHSTLRKTTSIIPKTIVINPTISFFSQDTTSEYEGCISLGPLRGLVDRSNTITFNAYNFIGEKFSKTVSGLESRIVQHELDHLNGVLFIDRMKDISSLIFHDELIKRQAYE